MAVTERVNDGNFSGREIACYSDGVNDYWIEQQRNGRFRIYESADTYSQTSGGVTMKGKAIRRYDPDAGAQEGKIGEWKTVAECEAYIDRWMRRQVQRARAEKSRGDCQFCKVSPIRGVVRHLYTCPLNPAAK
jgi:hypothetical protein